MKAIVYSLFGHGKPQEQDCFSFPSYLRGLAVNLRLARLLYPKWEIILETDKATYDAYKDYFDNVKLTIEINPPADLTLAMLWRLKPAFHHEGGKWKYTHVLCRDLDSPLTYREAQAVQYWINRDKALHCITDSVSHNLPMLGGMIGVRPDYFIERISAGSWEDMIAKGKYNWRQKGTDQTFLNQCIYPCFARHGSDSVTEHFVKGMPQSFLSDCHPEIQPMEIEGVSPLLNESNEIAGHIGAAGWYSGQLSKFLFKHKDRFNDLLEAEKTHKDIFYWTENLAF